MTILIVDDEVEYRLVMRSVMINAGHAVLMARDGLDALEKVQGAQIDLVICDIYMPVMDGIRFSRAVRAMPDKEKLPILFVSGNADQHSLDALKDPRYEGFLRKTACVEEVMLWIAFLTTPAEKRTRSYPRSGSSGIQTRTHNSSRTATRVPLL